MKKKKELENINIKPYSTFKGLSKVCLNEKTTCPKKKVFKKSKHHDRYKRKISK